MRTIGLPGLLRRTSWTFRMVDRLGLLCLAAVFVSLAAAMLTPVPARAEGPATAARRVALVVGIGRYEHATRLNNPPNDAAAMAKALQGLGFEVIQGIDPDRVAFMNALKEFSRKANGADLALVFYAGHGVQVDNENWILPRDAKVADRLDLKFEALTSDDLLSAMETAKARILLLDACRDNPFREGYLAQTASRSVSRGLARVNTVDTGTLIAFATSPGAVADDGGAEARGNSPFTTGLLEYIGQPGLEIRQVLTKVRQSVRAATNNRQTPWENSSLLSDVFLAGPAEAPPSADLTFWKQIQDSAEPALFKVFLERFPSSPRAPDAKNRLEALLKAAPPPAKEATPPQPPPVKPARDCPTCPEMVDIPAGSFIMGAALDDASASASEKPAHRAVVPAFSLARYPVTFDEWQACVADGGCTGRPSDAGWGQGRRPVINVSWSDARAYVDWLTRKTGKRYRLPSETEWEYAARAGTTTTRFWGDDDKDACRYANVYDQTARSAVPFNWKPHPCADGFVHTSPVGSFAANPWKLGDMIGNVWQWVADCWTPDYSGATGDTLTVSTGECSDRVLRGGSWMSDPQAARSTSRMRADPTEKDINIGFRVARDPG